MTRVFTIAELAKALEVHSVTARQFVREGRITHVHVGRQIRVGEAQLDAYLAGERSTQICETCRPLAGAIRRAS